MREEAIGSVRHYFGRPLVAEVMVERGALRVGDMIHIKGKHTDLTEILHSMQMEHSDISEALPGDDIGIKVAARVREGDRVYRVVPD